MVGMILQSEATWSVWSCPASWMLQWWTAPADSRSSCREACWAVKHRGSRQAKATGPSMDPQGDSEMVPEYDFGLWMERSPHLCIPLAQNWVLAHTDVVLELWSFRIPERKRGKNRPFVLFQSCPGMKWEVKLCSTGTGDSEPSHLPCGIRAHALQHWSSFSQGHFPGLSLPIPSDGACCVWVWAGEHLPWSLLWVSEPSSSLMLYHAVAVC